MQEADPRLLRLIRELDAERTARKKAEAREAHVRGVLKRVMQQRTADAQSTQHEQRPGC